MIKKIEQWKAVSWREDLYVDRDPTWGFYVFVTAYSDSASEQLSQAIENWVKVVQRDLEYSATVPVYANEAFRRFKLDVIADKDKLDDASDDRIREEFRAQIRDLRLSDDEDQIVPPARNMACFVLDEEKVVMLADLSLPDDPMQEYELFSQKTVKVLDAYWHRPSTSNGSSYRGMGYCSITSLHWLYTLLTSGDRIEDFHPLNGTP